MESTADCLKRTIENLKEILNEWESGADAKTTLRNLKNAEEPLKKAKANLEAHIAD